MPLLIDIEKDYLYQLGMKKAKEQTEKMLQKQEQEKKALLEKTKAIGKAAKLLEKQKAEKIHAEKLNSIQKMRENEVAKEMIALFMGLSLAEVDDYLEEIEKSKEK